MAIKASDRELVEKVAQLRKEHWEINKKNDNAIEVENLVVDFGETLAIKGISLEMKRGELITLVGPSGCGKTTLLNTIAGLLTPSSGKIIFNSKNVTKASPKERKLGFVFQNYALYPHLSVYKNIAFPLSNDDKWKEGINKKNELNELRVFEVKLKRAGASQKEINKMFDMFFNVFDAKKQANTYYASLTEDRDKNVWSTKGNLEFVKSKRQQKIKKMSDEQLMILTKEAEKITIAKKNPTISKEELQTLKRENKEVIAHSKLTYKNELKRIHDEFKLEYAEALAEYKNAVKERKASTLGKKISDAKRNKRIISRVSRKLFDEYKEELISKYSIKTLSGLTDEDMTKIREHQSKILKIKQVIHNEVMRVSEVVGITKNLSKKPTKLSGGQQQRVAIARAIVKNPDILLMDEPLSNLDAKLRISTREWIRNVQKTLGITTVFVTHDQEEAMAISDTVVCMSEGEIQQIGNPIELYKNPANTFVAKFIGMPEMKVFEAKVDANKNVVVDGVKMCKTDSKLKKVLLGARAEFLKETKKGKGLPVEIINVSKLGREVLVTVKSKKLGEIKVYLDVNKDYKDGETIYLNITDKNVILFDPETGERI